MAQSIQISLLIKRHLFAFERWLALLPKRVQSFLVVVTVIHDTAEALHSFEQLGRDGVGAGEQSQLFLHHRDA